jgi:hypothetical protein
MVGLLKQYLFSVTLKAKNMEDASILNLAKVKLYILCECFFSLFMRGKIYRKQFDEQYGKYCFDIGMKFRKLTPITGIKPYTTEYNT